MLIAVVALVVAVCVPLIGGRYSALGQLRLRGTSLVYGALATQIAIISVFDVDSEFVSRGLHILTYAMIGVCLVLNRTVRWLWIVAVGWLCNFAAIVANAGVMPLASSAEPGGQTVASTTFENSAPVADARLTFLSDIIATPRGLPMANTLSIGDLLLLAGVAIVIFAASRAPVGKPNAPDIQDTLVTPGVPATTSHVLTGSTSDASSN